MHVKDMSPEEASVVVEAAAHRNPHPHTQSLSEVYPYPYSDSDADSVARSYSELEYGVGPEVGPDAGFTGRGVGEEGVDHRRLPPWMVSRGSASLSTSTVAASAVAASTAVASLPSPSATETT